MTPIRFTVVGLAQPKGSTRMFAIRKPIRSLADVRITSDNPKVKAWQTVIAKAAGLALGGAALELVGALMVECVFYLPRPASHGKNGDAYPIVRPDVDKLARAVGDALTGVVWRDDGQIVELVARKRYAESLATARVEVTITPIVDALPLFPSVERMPHGTRRPRSAHPRTGTRSGVADPAVPW